VLTPDFLGVEEEALHTVLAARPEVFNHNIETVRRLHRACAARRRATTGALAAARAKEIADYPVLTKSGIIVGLGETNDEVVETMRDLRAHGVDVVTIGQYLQPSSKHATIDRWVHPDEFRWFREQGEALGFGSVFSRPARALELPRRRAASRCRDRPRRGRVLGTRSLDARPGPGPAWSVSSR
jgi:lipoic acid synthetase